jgi:hypothetical protein
MREYSINAMLAALAFVLALQQEPAVVDQPVYVNAHWGVSLRRLFDDWVFAPDSARGSTTIIFQPRNGSLGEQLWGALILSSWGRPVPLRQVASRRITSTWRSTLGGSFDLRARDSLDIDGFPAVHIVMSGVIGRTAVEVEEYLIARDSDLVALQFRYPRGLPRDSINAGYLRSLAGLTLRGAAAQPWTMSVQRDYLLFDLPEDEQAIAPGWLSSEVQANGRRLMRWTSLVGAPDSTTVFVVGRYRPETRRFGRLTIRVWRNLATDSMITRATDEMLAPLAQAWAVYWQDFGPVPTTEISVVETSWIATRGGPAAVFLGSDLRSPLAAQILRRELSRTWWGGIVRVDAGSARLLTELAEWSARLAGPPPVPGSSDYVIERIWSSTPSFREAIGTLVAESRGGSAATSRFYAVLGDSAASRLQRALR